MGLLQRIKWIKNVKRDDGTAIAYFDRQDAENFLLGFGPRHAAGAKKPKEGDAIVIFQTLNNITYLTHLVIVNCSTAYSTGNPNYPIGRGVRVLARVNPFNILDSTSIEMSFEHVNSGQLCNFDLFNKNNEPDDNRRTIIELFTPYF